MGHAIKVTLFTLLLGLSLGILLVQPVSAKETPMRVMTALAFGSLENADYGATGILDIGWEFGSVFGLALQGGLGISEEVGLGTERFSHMAVLVPATMTICSSKSWACPGSTFEFVIISGVGVSQFEGNWVSTLIAGAALDVFREFSNVELGLRAGVQGGFNVLDIQRLTVMMQLHLGVIVRFNLKRN